MRADPVERIIAIDAPHFFAGIVVRGDHVVEAAPILRWTVGKSYARLERYFASKRWRVVAEMRIAP